MPYQSPYTPNQLSLNVDEIKVAVGEWLERHHPDKAARIKDMRFTLTDVGESSDELDLRVYLHEEDHHWIWDVNGQVVKPGKRAQYHAFKEPSLTSVCGQMTTKTYETKTPGGLDLHCALCAKVAGFPEGFQD